MSEPVTGEPEQTEPWMDAATAAWWAWESLASARTVVQQADAVVAMSNAMSDLVTFLPDYDPETGELREEDVS